MLINIPLTVLLSLVLASALNAKLPFRAFFRTAYYIPYVTASVAVIGVWLWLFSGDGLVNTVLGPLAPEPSWLVNEFWAMPMIALSVTWKQLGFYVLLYLAALQNIPGELYEAAEVDGAGQVKRFTAITVPGVRSATTLVVILATIIGANLFTEPYLLTGGGGPDGASTSPVLLMYQSGIQQGNAGYAAAIGVVLAIGVMVVSGIQRSCWKGIDHGHDDGSRARHDRRSPPARPPRFDGPDPGHPGARRGRHRVPVPLLLHGHRLAAAGAPARTSPARSRIRRISRWTTICRDQRFASDLARSPAQLGDLHRAASSCALWSSACWLATPWPCCTSAAGHCLFTVMLLVLVLPFQLFMIPLYVLIVRDYGLSRQLPRDDPAVRDQLDRGASSSGSTSCSCPVSCSSPRGSTAPASSASSAAIAVPLARPAIVTAVIVTFIGPWNEFLWPFLITKQHDLQPLAVPSPTTSRRCRHGRPTPSAPILAGAVVLAIPAVGPVRGLPASVRPVESGLRGEGISAAVAAGEPG